MNNEYEIPFSDLYTQYLNTKYEIDQAIHNVISKSSFIRGDFVEEFEREFANLLDIMYCVSCGNGTDALYIAITSMGLKSGDEVIVPAHSWISTSEAVTQAGGIPVFCDTLADEFTINPKLIEEKITPKTVGIIPVHLYGQSADMTSIMSIAKKKGLWVIEDCAQAVLAKHKDKYVGTFGDAATFSFYPGKNLGAMGDAGAVITNSNSLFKRMAMFARHGGLHKGDHQIEGINSRMDGLQAAILLVKLKKILDWTKERQKIAGLYTVNLKCIEQIQTPFVGIDNEHVWHLYVIKTDKRDELKDFLQSKSIQSIINYPLALPFLPAYKRFGFNVGDFPNAFSNQGKILSLPIYPELSEQSVFKVINEVENFFK